MTRTDSATSNTTGSEVVGEGEGQRRSPVIDAHPQSCPTQEGEQEEADSGPAVRKTVASLPRSLSRHRRHPGWSYSRYSAGRDRPAGTSKPLLPPSSSSLQSAAHTERAGSPVRPLALCTRTTAPREELAVGRKRRLDPHRNYETCESRPHPTD